MILLNLSDDVANVELPIELRFIEDQPQFVIFISQCSEIHPPPFIWNRYFDINDIFVLTGYVVNPVFLGTLM